MNNTILCVDDDEVGPLILTEFFKSSGYKIDVANDVRTAQKKVIDTNYDVIITDYVMPFMNGAEFSYWLRKKGIDIPIVLLTAAMVEKKQNEIYIYLDESIETIKYGVINSFVRKPFIFNILSEACKNTKFDIFY